MVDHRGFFDLLDFIRESNRIEGITGKLSQTEIDAYHELLRMGLKVSIQDLQKFVSKIEPGAVLRDRPGLNVRVGTHVPPPGGPDIPVKLVALLDHLSKRSLTPFELHCEYESLHPFTDGNGRSGRALWLCQMGGKVPLGFLHHFYYQTLDAYGSSQ